MTPRPILTLLLLIVCLSGAQSATAQPAAVPTSPRNDKSDAAGQVIDLPTVLRLAGANNLDLALIKQALVQAQAVNDAATLSFLPSLSGGIGYAKHKGAIQNVTGNILDVDKQLHSEVGGVSAQVNLGEAIFQKLSARRLQSAAEYSVDASRNQTAFAAASAYFELVSARANVGIAQDAVGISLDYEDQLNRAATIGLANKSDVLRVSVQTQNYQVALRKAQETVRTASAQLATILHLNPADELKPTDQTVPQIALIPQDADLTALLKEAMDRRPEIKASADVLEAADWQKQQSIYGPLIPTIGAQALYGNIQGGPAGQPGVSGGSQDYALMFNGRVGPGGLLDFSKMDYAESKLEQGRLTDAKIHDEVSREVVQTFEGAHSAFDQLVLTKKSVDLAEQSRQLSQSRRDFGVAAVMEVIQAQKDLTDARGAYLRSLTQYAKLQYALAQAIGRLGE